MTHAWSAITPSSSGKLDNIRRADPSHPLDFWHGKDLTGRNLFVLNNPSVYSGVIPAAPAGIELQILNTGTKQSQLIITLLDPDGVEIFRVLCMDLLQATRELDNDGKKAVRVIFDRLKRWQEMLAARRLNILTVKQVIGLAGELYFLRDILLQKIPPRTAIDSWRGPYGDEQDFVLNNVIFEIKTQQATSDKDINISSEHQLDTGSCRIMICRQTIGPSTSIDARSLNQLVDEIKNFLSGHDISLVDLFSLGLFEAGYENRSEYGQSNWAIAERELYDVKNGFPRIVPADLEPGVRTVRYNISVVECKKFLLDIDRTMEGILNGTN